MVLYHFSWRSNPIPLLNIPLYSLFRNNCRSKFHHQENELLTIAGDYRNKFTSHLLSTGAESHNQHNTLRVMHVENIAEMR
jgi:hypothetical protein